MGVPNPIPPNPMAEKTTVKKAAKAAGLKTLDTLEEVEDQIHELKEEIAEHEHKIGLLNGKISRLNQKADRLSRMKVSNCINCGAPFNSDICEHCGTQRGYVYHARNYYPS